MIRVGPAGWSYKDWEGTVYPRLSPRGFHPLAFLARYVECIEINSTFYAIPRAEHAARWAELVHEHAHFRFTAKLHRDFTHGELPIEELEAELLAFRAGLEPLARAHKLAALLAQFPISFQHDAHAVRRLIALRARFDSTPLVIELRHRSWFEPPALSAVEGLGVSLAAIDLPPAWNHPPADHATPGPVGYLRLHGRNRETWFARESGRDQRYDYLYEPREVEELAQRARRLAETHDETYVITNNHFEGKAVANALELLHELRGTPVPAPRPLVDRYPRLARATRPDGQQELF